MKYSTIISAIIGISSAIVLPRQACSPLSIAKETVTVTVTAPYTAVSTREPFTNPLVPFLAPGPVAFPSPTSDSTTSTASSASVMSIVVATSSLSKSTRLVMFTPVLVSEPLTWSFVAPTLPTESIPSATSPPATTLTSSLLRLVW